MYKYGIKRKNKKRERKWQNILQNMVKIVKINRNNKKEYKKTKIKEKIKYKKVNLKHKII